MIKRVAKRLKRLWKQISKRSPYPQTVELSDLSPKAIKFRIHSDTERFRTLGFGGEREQLAYFLKYLQANDVFYDIGASVGLTALLAAVHCSDGQVIAFEPDKAIIKRIKANIEINRLTNVTVLPYAISRSNQEMVFYSAGADNVSPSLTGKNVKNIVLPSSNVQARTLDSLISNKETVLPTVLKIDIEGAEYDALVGAKRLLQGEFGDAPRLMYLELHPDFLPDYNTNMDEIHQFLKSLSYELVWEIQRDAQIHEIYVHRE